MIYSKIIKIFCIVDEFCKGYIQLIENQMLGNLAKRLSVMSPIEVIFKQH